MAFEEVEVNPEAIAYLAKGNLENYDIEFSELEERRALKSLEKDILDEFQELNSEEVKISRWKYFSIKGTGTEDYKESLYRTPEGGLLKMGIRHFGGNKELPFVKILSSQKIQSAELLNQLFQYIKNKYSLFNPIHVSFDSREKLNVDFIASVMMVAKTENVKSLEPLKGEELLTLNKLEDESYFEWYEKGYQSFHEKHPELKEKVPVCDRETLKESLDQSLLYEAKKDNLRVGLIAAEKEDFLGQPGLYFNEIFLIDEIRGQGLAKVLQRKFIKEVCLGNEFIWGTIDEHNIASYRTAEANGRTPVSYECFLKI